MFKRIYFWMDELLDIHDYIKKDVLDKPIPKKARLQPGGIAEDVSS